MFGMSHIFEIWIFVGLGVMVILFLMSSMARLYRKAGPHEALIVYGSRRHAGRQGTRHAGISRWSRYAASFRWN